MRHDGFRDTVDVAVRPGAEVNLPQRRVIGPGLRKRASEERMTAVGTHPPRKFPIEIVARGGSGARGTVAIPSFKAVAVDQAMRDLSRRRLIL